MLLETKQFQKEERYTHVLLNMCYDVPFSFDVVYIMFL